MTLNPAAAGPANAGWPCDCGCAERAPCYPTDLTDEQWAVLEPLLPVMLCLTVLGGRPEKHWRRTMIDAMFYICDNGCKWRALPADFPPFLWNLFCQESSGLSRCTSMIGNSVAVAGMPI